MPCSSEGWSDDDTTTDRELERVSAMLCGVLSAIGSDLEMVLRFFDEKESGVTTKELKKWWETHKEQDRLRRREEQRERQRKLLRRKALGKLSSDERKTLGLRDE